MPRFLLGIRHAMVTIELDSFQDDLIRQASEPSPFLCLKTASTDTCRPCCRKGARLLAHFVDILLMAQYTTIKRQQQ